MTTYLRPGVFVNESLQTLVNSPLPNSTDAIPAFVGTITKGGPVGPQLITSWAQFTALYGDIKGVVTDDLPFAVYQYFNNGGSACYVVRAVNSTATYGHVALAETTPPAIGSPVNGALTATAGGTLAATTYFVKTTWVTAAGETLASAETSLAVALNNVLNVAAPANPPASATGWNVYVSSTTGTETKQNATPIGLTSAWVEPTSGLISGAAVPSTNTAAGPAVTAMTVTALAPGAWSCTGSNAVYVTVDTNATTGRFNLTIEVGQGTGLVARETFSDITLDPTDPRYALTIVNSLTIGSKYVTLTANGTWSATPDDTHIGNPAAVSAVQLVGGSDGTGTPDLVAATELLETIPNILVINLPGITNASTITSIVTWAANLGNRFIVVDTAKPLSTNTNADVQLAATTLAATLPVSSYLAVYGPWVWASDPSSSVPGALRLTAPGGAVLGQYVRNDVTRGVQKVPAGTGTALKVNQVFCNFTNTQLDALNQAGVNVIRSVPGAGFCIMGGRTLNVSAVDKYINVRRTLMYLKKNLVNLTEFAVFENNDPNTWERVADIVTQFLRGFWLAGGLAGDTADQAFYVVCDSTNNNQASINAGVLNVQIGVALETPAEFIVISLGQFNNGTSTAVDSLAAAAQ